MPLKYIMYLPYGWQKVGAQSQCQTGVEKEIASLPLLLFMHLMHIILRMRCALGCAICGLLSPSSDCIQLKPLSQTPSRL